MTSVTAAHPIVHVGPARRITGRFATPADPKAVRPVHFPTGAVGHQVGPMGRVYADRRAALDFARARETRSARMAASFAQELEEAIKRAREARPVDDDIAEERDARELMPAGSDGDYIDGPTGPDDADAEWAATNLNDSGRYDQDDEEAGLDEEDDLDSR